MLISRAFALFLWAALALAAHGAEARIMKVLPHYLDLEGRNAISPSLYERDAYQDFLRKNPDQRSALRFDVHWKAKGSRPQPLLLKVEIRSASGNQIKPLVIQKTVKPSRWKSRWSSVAVEGKDYAELGEVVAWKASLWNGETQVAELKSFLW